MLNPSQIIQPFLEKAQTDIRQLDFYNSPVEYDNDPTKVASSEASHIFCVPPIMKDFYPKINPETGVLVPGGTGISARELTSLIGGVQNFNPNESKQTIPVEELGSRLKRLIPGKQVYGVSMSRLLTKHGNLKWTLYKWMYMYAKLVGSVNGQGNAQIEFKRAPGPTDAENKYFSGMESDIFDYPFGLLHTKATINGQIFAADYFEECYINAEGTSISAQNPLMFDSVQIYVSRIVPFTVRSSGKSKIDTIGNKGDVGGGYKSSAPLTFII